MHGNPDIPPDINFPANLRPCQLHVTPHGLLVDTQSASPGICLLDVRGVDHTLRVICFLRDAHDV